MKVSGLLEHETHAHFVKHWNILNNYPFMKNKLFSAHLMNLPLIEPMEFLLMAMLIFFILITFGLSDENEQLVLFLLVHNQIFASNDRNEFFIWRFFNSDNLVGLSCFGFEKRNWNFVKFSEILVAVNIDRVNICHENLAHPGNLYSFRPLHIFGTRAHPQIMEKFPLNDLKGLFVNFISNR